MSTEIAFRDFPRSRACDTIDKKNDHSSSLESSFSYFEIIFIIALQSLAELSFADSHGWSAKLSEDQRLDRIIFPLSVRVAIVSVVLQPNLPEIPLALVLISTQ